MTAFSLTTLSSFRVALVVAALALGGVLASLVAADTVPPNPTIALQKAVHFLTAAGEDLVVEPGTYEVEAAKEGLQLTPQGGEGAKAVVVQAQALPHGESLTAPKIDVGPAGEDQYRVALLLPDGTSLEAVGSYSGVSTRAVISTSSTNTAYGTRALAYNTTGDLNTAMGAYALLSNTRGSNNTAMGFSALYSNTAGDYNTAMGGGALGANTTGYHNTAMGISALHRNTTGVGNTAMGSSALVSNTTGGFNTAMGNDTLVNNTTGGANIAIGINALYRNTTGTGNLAIGGAAGRNQTVGNNNIYLSHQGVAGESGTIRFGTPGTHTRTFLTGVAGVPVSGSVVQVDANGQLGIRPSSRRYKEAIENMGTASEGLLHLRPVTFRYKSEVMTGERLREYGLIAEEVAEVYPELVGHDADGQIVTVQYHELIPMLLNELQQEHQHNQNQDRLIMEQRQQLEVLRAEVAALKTQ